MNGLFLLPRDGTRDGTRDGELPGHSPPKHGLAGLSRKAAQQNQTQQPPHPSPTSPNVARRISSMAAGLSDSIRSRVSESLAERRRQQLRNEQQQILELRMANAESYQDWEAAAHLLDELEGHEAWKANNDSDDFYRPDVVRARLQELEDARLSSDIRRMMHLVRTALSRDVGGISSAGLYSHTHTGTKYLVERYVNASVDLIRTLLDRSRSAVSLPKGLTHRDMLDQMLLARRSYGRSALVLSGGSVYGMAHIGVLKALFERRLLPRIISGTSAGSIVAAVVCTRTDHEIPEMLQLFALGDLAVFTDKDNPDSWLTHIGRALRYGAWHDSRHIARVMRDLVGDITFQEAFNRTRRILNITVSSKPGLKLPSLLNYLTAPDVIIWSAVVASCSIPGVFDPRPLLVRDAETGENVPWDPAEQLWIDGSLDNDVPVERLGSMLNVNHFIVSQTNPHIVLFVSDEKATAAASNKGSTSTTTTSTNIDANFSQGRTSSMSAIPPLSEILYTLGWLSKSEAIYYLETLVDLGCAFGGGASMLLQMLNQRYTADINILPRMSLAWSTNLIRNPTPEFMLEACRVGEQATWPSISRIEQACAVELALDKAVHTLRERIAFSDSQVNLRRLFTGAYELGRGPSTVPTLQRASPTMSRSQSRSQSPTAYRTPGHHPHSQGLVQVHAHGNAHAHTQSQGQVQGLGQTHYRRHRRRGSGGSIQLSARRRNTRFALETILSEDGGADSGRGANGDDDDDSSGGGRHSGSEDEGLSLAVRRGMGDLNLGGLGDSGPPPLMRSKSYNAPIVAHPLTACTPGSSHRLIPPYRGAVKQNSLQQLPMSGPSSKVQTPSPTASFTRKGYSWGLGGGTTPFTGVHDAEDAYPFASSAAADDDDLQMKARQRRQRRHSSTASAVSAVSAAAAAAVSAVAAAHQAVMQATGGGGADGSRQASTYSEPQSPMAQRTQLASLASSTPIPMLSRVPSTHYYPGVLGRGLSHAVDVDEEDEEDDDDEETSGDFSSTGAVVPKTPPRRQVRLVRRCKSVPAMAMVEGHPGDAGGHGLLFQSVPKRTSPKRMPTDETAEYDETGEEDDEIDGDETDDDVFMSGGRGG